VRARRWCLAVLLGLGMVGAAPAAWAGPVEDAVEGLRDGPVYLHPASGRELDVDAVRAAIGDEPIRIAILPQGPGTSEVRTWPREISRRLPGSTVAVISGRYFYAGSDVLCRGVAGQAATNAITRHNTALDQEANSDLTAALTDFVAELSTAPRCPGSGGAGRGDRDADEPGGGEAVADDTAAVLPFVAGGPALVVLGVGVWVLLARRTAAGRSARRRTETRELVARLAAEVDALPDGPAGSTAAARHAEAMALLPGATTDTQYEAVRAVALAGLTAAGEARSGGPAPSANFFLRH
jgi:hypothetical protein